MPRTIAGRRRTDSGTLPQWVAPQQTRPRSSLAEASVSPSFFFRVPEKTPRTVWRCHPVALATSSTVAPSALGRTLQRIHTAKLDEKPVTRSLDQPAIMRSDRRINQLGADRLQCLKGAALVRA